jgi:hypothetical protein
LRFDLGILASFGNCFGYFFKKMGDFLPMFLSLFITADSARLEQTQAAALVSPPNNLKQK